MSGSPVPEIRLVGLTKQFGEVRAVDGVDLEIRAGEFFSLLGPSGCGKTTTLRMIGGFELPTGGRIELQGRDVTHAPPDKRPVNMVFQNYALFPHLNVGDNIAFGLRRRKVADRETTQRVDEALQLVKLAGYQKRKPHELSGGQQQRVALARALVNRPDVLLLDEPLGALDLKLRRPLQVELKRIQTEVGITFVYVTHDQEEALALSDRIAVMHARQGRAARARPRSCTTPRDAVRGRLHRHDQPAARDRRGRGRRGRRLALGSGERIRAAGAGLRAGAGRRAQRPPRDHRRAPCQRPIRRCRRRSAAGSSRSPTLGHRPLHRPNDRGTQCQRRRTQDRGSPCGRQCGGPRLAGHEALVLAGPADARQEEADA